MSTECTRCLWCVPRGERLGGDGWLRALQSDQTPLSYTRMADTAKERRLWVSLILFQQQVLPQRGAMSRPSPAWGTTAGTALGPSTCSASIALPGRSHVRLKSTATARLEACQCGVAFCLTRDRCQSVGNESRRGCSFAECHQGWKHW